MTYFGDSVPVFGQDRGENFFITFLILNEFSCHEVHIPCHCNQQTSIEVFFCLCAVAFTQPRAKTECGKLQRAWKHLLDNSLLQKR